MGFRKKKKKGKTKLEAERAHCKRRFMERYAIDFNRHMRREFERLIQYCQTHLVRKQSNRVSIHDVIYEGEVYRVVYDKSRKTIVTVLPADKDILIEEEEIL